MVKHFINLISMHVPIYIPQDNLLSVLKNNEKFLLQRYLALVVLSWFPCEQAGEEHSLFFSNVIVHFRKKWNFFFGRLFGVMVVSMSTKCKQKIFRIFF